MRTALRPLSLRAKRGTCCLLVILGACAALAQERPPDGWRRPTGTESADEWRQKSQTRFFVVRGDFDGDGKPDLAELLVNPTSKKFALFVKLFSVGKWQQLGESYDLGSLQRFGINLVKPGKYETACGKGYDDSFCAHGEPDYLTLGHPAIDFIYTESSDSIFYWDTKTRRFREIAMSD
jgi:hypothetical protein